MEIGYEEYFHALSPKVPKTPGGVDPNIPSCVGQSARHPGGSPLARPPARSASIRPRC